LRASTTDRLFVREIGIFLPAATASTFGLARAATVGATPTTPITLVAEDPASPAATATSAIAWATPPVVPTNPNRRITLPATIGAGIVWTFGNQGFVIPASGSLVLWNLATSAAAVDIYAVVDE
jgi:hypothetical protein